MIHSTLVRSCSRSSVSDSNPWRFGGCHGFHVSVTHRRISVEVVGMFLAPGCLFTWWELAWVSSNKARLRGAQGPVQRRSDLPVMSHLWRVMDFPLALLPQLSGEKAGLIRWFICTFPPLVMDGTPTFPWNFIISWPVPPPPPESPCKIKRGWGCVRERESRTRHAGQEEGEKKADHSSLSTSLFRLQVWGRGVELLNIK